MGSGAHFACALQATLSQHPKGHDVAELKGAVQAAQVVRAKLNGGVFPDRVQREMNRF